MRQIGTLSGEREAIALVDFLLTEGIRAQADEEAGHWTIWVREENQLEPAREILEQFQRHPDDPKYSSAKAVAQQLRAESQRQVNEAAKRTIDVRRQWNQRLSRRAPLVMVLIGLSIFASLATRFGSDPQSEMLHALMFSDARAVGPLRLDAPYDPLSAIKHGQLWRMVTPIFLHANVLHLFFNMWWLYTLGPQIEARRGTARFGAMVMVLALASNWAQFLIGQNPNFMGMSGVVYGIFGYLWVTLKMDPRAGYLLSEGTVFIMFAVLVAGFAGILGGLANWAHAGGLVTGMAIAYGATVLRSSPSGRS